jgi:hypothetical protein
MDPRPPPYARAERDFLRLGKRESVTSLYSTLYCVDRVVYELEGVRMPVIEKYRSMPFRKPRPKSLAQRSADLLYRLSARGVQVPALVCTARDLAPFKETHPDTLFLSDLTEGEEVPIIDLYPPYATTPAAKRLDVQEFNTLRNVDDMREALAFGLAALVEERVNPRIDVFMVVDRGGKGDFYAVDTNWACRDSISPQDAVRWRNGEAVSECLFHNSHIEEWDAILSRMCELLKNK